MGTSLVVQPFASLIDRVPKECPRLLLNREVPSCAKFNPIMALMGHDSGKNFSKVLYIVAYVTYILGH
jgi:NAD-dependent deacetylase sirtuin 2